MTDCQALTISLTEEPGEILRARFQQEGYLHFKQAVDAGKCAGLLRAFIRELEPHVALDPDSGLPVLTGEPFFETDPTWDLVYPRMQSLQEFHRFFHEDDVQSLMRIVAGERVFVYPMKMARVATPGKIGYETPPHQDAHSHHAGPSMAGIWVALHDVRRGMGRLQLLPGSHTHGVRQVFQAPGVGGVQCEIFPQETTWHVSDVEQGDVILFHSCCVHRAEPNTAERLVRISIDTRFCDYGAPVFITNIEPHHGWRIPGHSWENIYRSWADQELQYYWQDYPGLFSEFGGARW